jgi:hypothetical protein
MSIPVFYFPGRGRRGVDQHAPKHGGNVVGGVKNPPVQFVGVRRVDLFVAGVVRRVGLFRLREYGMVRVLEDLLGTTDDLLGMVKGSGGTFLCQYDKGVTSQERML